MKRSYIYAAVLGFLCASAVLLHAIFTSTNSTSSIGFLYLPVFGGVGALFFMSALYLAETIVGTVRGKEPVGSPRFWKASVLLGVFSWCLLCWFLQYSALRVVMNENVTPAELTEVYGRWLPYNRFDVEVQIAKNPKAPISILQKMVREGNENLVALVGINESTPVELLVKIGNGERTYTRMAGIAANPRTPAETMERIASVSLKNFPSKVEYNLYQTYVLGPLARNPSTPRELFDRLAAWDHPEYFLVYGVIQSPQVTCDQLKLFFRYEREVMRNTARNLFVKKGCTD